MSTRQRLFEVAVAVVAFACGGSTGKDAATGGAGGAAAGNGGIGGGGTGAIGGRGGGTNGGTGGAGGSVGGVGGISGASADLVGKWVGYVENHKFSDSTDTITLTIASPQIDGSVVFGQSPAPPPPTDPNVGYPPGVTFSSGPMQGPVVGFAYTILSPSFDGERLQFDASPNEVWKLWCEMQTPIADETNPGMYSCVPNWGFESGTGGCFQTNPKTQQKVQVDCGKLMLCSMGSPCKCTAQGCTTDVSGGIHFDMSVALPKADGSASGLGGLNNVHLKKQ